jgi:hypothetical protein
LKSIVFFAIVLGVYIIISGAFLYTLSFLLVFLISLIVLAYVDPLSPGSLNGATSSFTVSFFETYELTALDTSGSFIKFSLFSILLI